MLDLKKLCMVLPLCIVAIALVETASASECPNDTKHIKISNDSSDVIYYLLQSGAMVYGNGEVLAKSPSGIAGNVDLCITQDHWGAGRVYFSYQPFHYVGDQPDVNYPDQFIEYAFDDAANYDFSAVDSLYSMPLAMEAIDNPNAKALGYVGMPNKLDHAALKAKFDNFHTVSGWPFFDGSVDKLPGKELFFSPQYSQSGDAFRQELTAKWFAWYQDKNYAMCQKQGASRPFKYCQLFENSVKNLMQSLIKNASDNGVILNLNDEKDKELLMRNITSFVPFGKIAPPNWTGTLTAEASGLESGISNINATDEKSLGYEYPDYSSAYCLNPYVTFIHKVLNLQIYAYSIDDAIGYIRALGFNGIQIDINSISSLPNQSPYQRT